MLLEICNLHVDLYVNRQTLHVLRGVDLTIRAGDRMALVGESGSGKTMTGLSVIGLLPSSARIISGQILLEAVNIIHLPERKLSKLRGQQMVMIFQNALTSLNPLIRVGDQIADVYRKRQKLTKTEAIDKAVKALEATGIPDPADRARNYPHEFSGGMAQRALIALALASEPTLLIADEPTSGLDVTIQTQVIALIQGLADRLNTTLLIISHDIGLISTICNRIAVMYAGMVMESGTTDQIMQHSANPYSKALIECAVGQSQGKTMPFIPGRVMDLDQEWNGCPFAPRCPFAQEICSIQAPPVVEVSDGHFSRCHFVEKLFGHQSSTGE